MLGIFYQEPELKKAAMLIGKAWGLKGYLFKTQATPYTFKYVTITILFQNYTLHTTIVENIIKMLFSSFL